MPGSESMAGHPTDRIGTWESHAVPTRSLQQAEEARRRYGGMAVGPAHTRGVAGIMPGGTRSSLEGAGSKTQRDEAAFAVHRDGRSNVDKISPPIGAGPAGS